MMKKPLLFITSLISLTMTLLFFNINKGFAQGLRLISTKELIKISRKEGLENTLKIIGNVPLFNLDPKAAHILAKQVLRTKVSFGTTEFLIHYSYYAKDSAINKILYTHFIKHGVAESYHNNPKTQLLYGGIFSAMSNHPTKKTESYYWQLFDYWSNQSMLYKNQLDLVIDSTKKADLLTKYIESNANCHTIYYEGLYFLNSSRFRQTILDSLCDLLPKERRYSVYKSSHNFDEPDGEIKLVELEQEYTNLADPHLYEESSLNRYFCTGKNIEYGCKQIIIYNNKTGYFFSTNNRIRGSEYKIELIDKKKVKISLLRSWIS